MIQKATHTLTLLRQSAHPMAKSTMQVGIDRHEADSRMKPGDVVGVDVGAW